MTNKNTPLIETKKLENAELGPLMPLRTAVTKPSTLKKVPWRLRMQISGESHTTIGMEVKEKIIIGRQDSTAEFDPDLDLTPFGGVVGGVSRRHAKIIRQDKTLFVEDLDSKNHTCLNGFVLKAHQRYRLRDGDELMIGTIRIVVRFIKTPGIIT